MALIPSALVKDGNVVGSILPDISSAIGYKETIGSTCVNPDGYTTGKFFVGATDGLFYRATDDIDTGDTITVGTNCEQTDVATVLALLNDDVTAINSDLTELNCGRGYVEYSVTGTSTYGQMLNALWNLIDLAKMTDNAKLVLIGATGTHLIYTCRSFSSTSIGFYSSSTAMSSPYVYCDDIAIMPNNSFYHQCTPAGATNVTNNSVGNSTFRLYY